MRVFTSKDSPFANDGQAMNERTDLSEGEKAMRVFKIYRYNLGKKVDVAAIFREIAERHPPQRILFHIENMDRVHDAYAAGLPRQQQMELSPMIKSMGFLSKYAYPKLFDFWDISGDSKTDPEYFTKGQNCLGVGFWASNLDENWECPAPYGQGESLAFDEALQLLSYKKRKHVNVRGT